MKLHAFVQFCVDSSIRFTLERDQLRIRAAPGALTDDLLRQIKERKDELVDWLRQQNSKRIVPRQQDQEIPLSFAQKRLWLIDQFEEDTSHYNEFRAMRIRGKCETEFVESAFKRIIERHELLRSRFLEGESGPIQVPHADADFRLQTESLEGLSEQECERRLDELLSAELNHSFNLEHDTLIRVLHIAEASDVCVLVINTHHMISDSWSIKILIEEFIHIYQHHSRGLKDSLAPIDIQYADFACWQNVQYSAAASQPRLEYWKNLLAGAPELHGFPLDKARPKQQSFDAGQHFSVIEGELLDDLQACCQENEVTMFMLLQTAYAVLLARYSGDNKVVLGVPTAGRERSELNPLIGFFVDTQLSCVDLGDDPTFRTALTETKAQAMAEYSMPFDSIVEGLNPHREISYNPVCQLKFLLEVEQPAEPLELDWEISHVGNTREYVRFDLDLTVQQSDSKLLLSWKYKQDLFVASTIRDLAKRFTRLLSSATCNMDLPVSMLELLDEHEQNNLIASGAGAVRPVPPGVTVLDEFERQAREYPERIAVRSGSCAMSYQELDVKSNRLADLLIESGVEQGDHLIVYVDRSPVLMVAVLAILKTGASYIPIDSGLGSSRLLQIQKNAHVETMLSLQSLLGGLTTPGCDVVLLDDWQTGHWLDSYSAETPDRSLTGEDSAYVIYTSGSTGTPNGVNISHAGLIDYLIFAKSAYYEDHLEGSIAVTSHSFDITVPSLFLPLLSGDAVEFLSSSATLDALCEYLPTSGDKLLRMTPMHVEGMLALLPDNFISSNRHVFVIGGEQLGADLARRLQRQFPHSQLYNHYGPTECVVGCALYDVTANLEELGGPVPIGRPMDNHQLFVLDETGSVLPNGVVGELFIAGAGLAKEYINNKELTEQRFRPNPFGDGKVYASGDLVRWNHNHELEFFVRTDDQMKVRGFRVEPGEIESALKLHPAVSQSVVCMKRNASNNPVLVAYIVCELQESGENEAAVHDLKAFVRSHLPEYMVPEAFVEIDRIPLNGNGKIDKKALPAPAGSDLPEFIAPETTTQVRVSDIWRTYLGVDQVSLHSRFFELGGHSLLAAKVAGEIARKMDKKVSMRALFEHETLLELCSHVDSLPHQGCEPIVALRDSERVHLSHAQRRLWFVDQYEGGSAHYNMPMSFAVQGQPDIEAFQQALDSIVHRHKILRSSIQVRNGEPYLELRSDYKVTCRQRNLVNVSAKQQATKIKNIIYEEYTDPFDLSSDVLLRAQIIVLGPTTFTVLITTHHIVCDGLSLEILARELTALYNAFSQNLPYPLEPLKIQYADFSAWQQCTAQSRKIDEQLAYWMQRLRDVPLVHGLPTDYARSGQMGYQGEVVSLRLDAPLKQGIDRYCREQSVTSFMLMHSALSVLIGRFSNESDVAIGVPVSGRVHDDTEPLIGYFANTLVLRSDFTSNPSFDELLAENKHHMLDAFSNQDVPFEMLVERLNPKRSLVHNPIVQITITLRNESESSSDLVGLELSSVQESFSAAKFDLELYVTERSKTLEVDWVYNCALFKRETIEQMSKSLGVLLTSVLEHGDMTVQSLPIVSSDDLDAMALCIAHQKTYPHSEMVHHQIQRLASTSPGSIAIDDGEQSLSYQALNDQSNQVARFLVDAGVTPNSKIGVVLSPSPKMVTVLLAIFKTGSAYVPIDPRYPASRRDYVIGDAALTFLICDSTDCVKPSIHDVTYIDVNSPEVAESVSSASTENINIVDAMPSRERVAYVIYTSGSTGNPKGVVVSHHNLSRLFLASDELFEFRVDDVWTVFHSFAFDFSVWEIWGALVHGAKLVIVPEQTRADSRAFCQLLLEQDVTVLSQTPSAFYNLLDEPGFVNLSRLRYVVFGGEALNYRRLAKWFSLWDEPQAKLINMYGITETTVHVTYEPVTYDMCTEHCRAIGRPLPDLSTVVCSADGAIQPFGAIGELYVTGGGVSLGYLNGDNHPDPKFIDHAFVDGPVRRYYKTGDTVRAYGNGSLDYIGRNDQQVSIHGFRIDPSEVVTQLIKLDDVQDAFVMARKDGSNQQRLVAYVVMNGSDETADTDSVARDLQNRLSTSLPKYMMPAVFIFMASMPLTRNGKLDVSSLPAPNESDLLRRAYLAPESSHQAIVCELFKELLKLDQAVGIDDDFFELGGHSLLATRLASAIREELGKELTLRQIFEGPTARQLSALIEETNEKAPLPALRRQTERTSFPLSFAQQRLWFIDQFAEGSRHYNTVAAVKVSGELSNAAFTSAVSRIVNRHEILRTNFHQSDGVPVQAVNEHIELPLEYSDLSGVSNHADKLDQIASEIARQEFDLEHQPVFKVFLIKLETNEHVVVFLIHHIASDGWSSSVVINEFKAAYRAAMHNHSFELPEMGIQYGDYAAWLKSEEMAWLLEEQLGYWQKQLCQLPIVHKLPTKNGHPDTVQFDSSLFSQRLDAETQSRIQTYCSQRKITLFMFLETIVALVVSAYSGEDDIAIATPVAGRVDRQLERLIGCFLNTLVIRTTLDASDTVESLMMSNRQTILDAFSNQIIPFESLVDEVCQSRDTRFNPLCQIKFLLQNFPEEEMDAPGLRFEPVGLSVDGHVRFDLDITAYTDSDGIVLYWNYKKVLFDSSLIEAMAESYRALIERILEGNDERLSDLSALSMGQVKHLVSMGKGRDTLDETLPGVLDLIEQQATDTPAATAVRYGQQSITYAQLMSKSNQLANYLEDLGIQANDRVGILLERSIEFVVAQLAIMKMGAAYVPIEPSQARDRVEYICTDARIEVICSSGEMLAKRVLAGIDLVTLDGCVEDDAWLESYSSATVNNCIDLHSTAYVIYTSGTTGRPKGVEISHLGLADYCVAAKSGYYAEHLEGSLLVTSVSFDISIPSLLLPLIQGGSVEVLVNDSELDTLVAQLLSRETGARLIRITPTYFRAVLDSLGPGDIIFEKHHFVIGGEQLYSEVLSLATKHFPNARLFNHYGPTETVVGCCFMEVTDLQTECEVVPIGRPMDNVSLYVCDNQGRLAPHGTSGELYIGSVGVSRGYLNHAELNKQKFLDNPFVRSSGSKLFRTGDKVRWKSDGTLEFIRRIDDQIKLNGFRIELDEIATSIRSLDTVMDAQLLVKSGHSDESDYLCAYVKVSESAQPEDGKSNKAEADQASIVAIRNHLSTLLPGYMVPSAFVFLEEFPLNKNAKIDRERLQSLEEIRLKSLTVVKPETQLERQIAEIWTDLLGATDINVHDNFFDLGGHSLLVFKLINQFEKQFKVKLKTKEVFAYPTVRELSIILIDKLDEEGRHSELFDSMTELEEHEF